MSRKRDSVHLAGDKRDAGMTASGADLAHNEARTACPRLAAELLNWRLEAGS
jgi:hypothetical protein